MATDRPKPICNPHLGKPAYIVADNPCEKVKKPCDLQEIPIEEPVEEVDEPLVTPDCLAVVFASDSDETSPNTFSYDEDSGNYEDSSGNTIIYDSALGWIVQTTSSYTPVVKTNNPTNNYCNSNGEVVSIVPCDKTGGAFLPDCVKTIFSEDDTVVLGEFSNDDGEFTASDSDQGELVFDDGWTLTVDGVVYTGPSSEGEVTGIYMNPDGQCILIKPCS